MTAFEWAIIALMACNTVVNTMILIGCNAIFDRVGYVIRITRAIMYGRTEY